MKSTLLITIAIALSSTLFSQSWEITPWFENKTAAVSITFDDNCDGQFSHAQPIMDARNIKSTFFVITGKAPWSDLTVAAQSAHEIASHTRSHSDLSKLSAHDLNYQLQDSHDAIINHFPNKKFVSLSYPFGIGAGDSDKDNDIRENVAKYYINGRGINGAYWGSPKGYDRYTEYQEAFFDNYYYQTGGYVMAPETSITTFCGNLDNAIINGGWSIVLYHGIETGGYNNIEASVFEEHMDSIQARNNNMWVATYGDVVRYHKERNSAVLSDKGATDTTWIFELTDSYDEDTIYNHPLTIRLQPADWMLVDSIQQANTTLSHIIDGNIIQFNAIPDGGDIIVYKQNNFTSCDANTPQQVEKINLSFNTDTAFTLSWKQSPESNCVSSYQVYMDGVEIGSTISTNFHLPHLTTGTTYSFYTTASNSYGVSNNSDTLTVLIGFITPETPENINQTAVTNNSISIKWNAVTSPHGISGYDVYMGTGLASYYYDSTTDTSYVFTDLETDKSYVIRLLTRDLLGNESALSDKLRITTLTSIRSNSSNNEFRIYPNPSHNNFTINALADYNTKYKLTVSNLSGRIVINKNIASDNNCEIGKNLPAGIYLINITNSKTNRTYKVIKY